MHDQETTPSKQIKMLDKTRWQALIVEWKKSNESQKAFCNRLGLNVNTFTYMRGKLLQEDKGPKATKFIPVTVSEANKLIDICEVTLESPNE